MSGYSVGAPVDCETVAIALLLAAHSPPRVLVVGRFCLGEFYAGVRFRARVGLTLTFVKGVKLTP